jgi:outer membrane protein TolC
MRRWLKRILVMIAACGMAAGCKQQMFLSKECFDQASSLLPPPEIENDFSVGNTPLTAATKAPPTLDDPDRPARHLTLREAFAIALENGSVSDLNGSTISGLVNDNLPAFTTGAGFNAQTDRVKALALNPAIAGANLEASLSRFDAVFASEVKWLTADSLTQGLSNFTNGNTGQFYSGIIKPNTYGGVMSVNFINNYRQLSQNPPGAISPLYESRLDIGFEQPLWQNAGADINQVLSRFPTFNGAGLGRNSISGAIGNSGAAAVNSRQNTGNILGVGTEGILISRVRVEQQRAEFERRIHNLLINVEAAYWKLFQAYGRLYSFEEVLRIAHKSWMTSEAKFIAGNIGPATYYPILGQYHEFQGERRQSLGAVIEAERNLRGLMGLPVEDGTRLVPIDSPTLAPYQPNWEASVQMALMQKPELAIARENLRASQFAFVSQRNFLKPDLRFYGRYSPVGFGTRLDGNGVMTDGAGIVRPSNALDSLAAAQFNEWDLGLQMTMPLGFRLEHAAVRSARLSLHQSYILLQDSETRVARAMSGDYGKIVEWWRLMEARKAERKSYADAVEARFREFAVGKNTVADFLLEAQRRLATAQVKEYEAIAEYNIALARFEWRKGNILKHNNVVIAEGALPECAEQRAVEHERERAKAIILRQRPANETPGLYVGKMQGAPNGFASPYVGSEMSPNYLPNGMNMPAGMAPATMPAGSGAVVVEPANGLPAFRSVPSDSLPGGAERQDPAPALGNGPTSPVPLRALPPKD